MYALKVCSLTSDLIYSSQFSKVRFVFFFLAGLGTSIDYFSFSSENPRLTKRKKTVVYTLIEKLTYAVSFTRT